MNQDAIMEILKDVNKVDTFCAGYLTACRVSGIPVPHDMKHDPNQARAWVVARILCHNEETELQARKDARVIVNAFGDKRPHYLDDLDNIAPEPEPEPGPEPGPGPEPDGNPAPPEAPANPEDTRQPLPDGVVRNCNRLLSQTMSLFQHGASYLGVISHEERRELARMILTANGDLSRAPFWNDIEGFTDPYGHPIQELTTSPSQQAHATSVELKRQYLSSVVIPECLRILADYIRREICASVQTDDALQVGRFLGAF